QSIFSCQLHTRVYSMRMPPPHPPGYTEDFRLKAMQNNSSFPHLGLGRRRSALTHRRRVAHGERDRNWPIQKSIAMKMGMDHVVATGGRNGSASSAREKLAAGKGQGKENGGKDGKLAVARRLWKETSPDKGRLALSMVCLVVNSATNIMTPAVMARVIDRAASSHKSGRAGGGGIASAWGAGVSSVGSASMPRFGIGPIGDVVRAALKALGL
ncbi:unnamed protein product, partial [Discosporangium mesarthrocarpum]